MQINKISCFPSFDTNIPGMIFSDQYIQLSTRLASSNIYGFGEHTNEKYKHDTNWIKWSLFSRNTPTDVSVLYSNIKNQ